MINFRDLEDANVNMDAFIEDLLKPLIQQANSIENADEIITNLLAQIDDIQNSLENKKTKVNKELQTALAIAEINIENKIKEQNEARSELRKYHQEHVQLQQQLK